MGESDTIVMNFRGLRTSREIDEIIDGAIRRNGRRHCPLCRFMAWLRR